jgi:hypothetical protein
MHNQFSSLKLISLLVLRLTYRRFGRWSPRMAFGLELTMTLLVCPLCPRLPCVHGSLVSTTPLFPRLPCFHGSLCPRPLCFHGSLCPRLPCVHGPFVSTAPLCLRLPCFHGSLVHDPVSKFQSCLSLMPDVLPAEDFSRVMSAHVPFPAWSPHWACRYTVLDPPRSVITNLGYLIGGSHGQ